MALEIITESEQKFMQLDFKRAILLPFKGKDWLLRLIILGALSISIVGSEYNINNVNLIIIILAPLLLGYYCQFAHNEFNNIFPSLPSWKLDFIRYFKNGFICFIGGTITFIVLLIMLCPIAGLLIEANQKNFLKYFNSSIHLLDIILTIFIMPCLYSIDFKFKKMIGVFKILRIFSYAKSEFFVWFLIFIIMHIALKSISIHITSFYIRIILMSLILSISYLTVFDLFIQAFSLSKERETN